MGGVGKEGGRGRREKQSEGGRLEGKRMQSYCLRTLAISSFAIISAIEDSEGSSLSPTGLPAVSELSSGSSGVWYDSRSSSDDDLS